MNSVKSHLRGAAKSVAARAGLEVKASQLLDAATRNGRRDLRDNSHLKVVLAACLAPDSNCVDVGANQGRVLEEMLRLAPYGQHHAIEALPELADRLPRHASVAVHQVAASDVEGVAEFTRAVGAEGYSRLSSTLPVDVPVEKFSVRTARLDDLIPDSCAVDFIKVDVEGAEYHALLGAERILRENRPTLWVEHQRTRSGFRGASSSDLWDLLCDEHGYRLFDADGNGPIDRDTLLPIPGSPMMWNWLARPTT